MKQLFEPGFVYPSDHLGCYTELNGRIVEIDDRDDFDYLFIFVQTEYGIFRGVWRPIGGHKPKVDYYAKIKVYRYGGGFYPDDVITSWSIEKYKE